MKKKTSIICVLISVLLLFSLFYFRVVPKVQLWKNYTTVGIRNDGLYKEAIKVLLTHGVDDILFIDSSVEENKTKLDNKTDKLSFSYFTDKSGQYNIIYFPTEKDSLYKSILTKAKINFTSDTDIKYPYISSIVLLFVFFFLVKYRKEDLEIILLQLPFVFLSFCIPYPIISILLLLLLLLISLFVVYKDRKHSFRVFLKNPIIYLIIIFIFLGLFISGKNSMVLFAISSIAAFLLFISTNSFIRESNKEVKPFTYSKILIANYIPKEQKYCVFNLIIPMFAFLFYTILVTGFYESKALNSSSLCIPAPKEFVDDEGFTTKTYEELGKLRNNIDKNLLVLPDLSDYIKQKWFLEVFPYNKVTNKTNELKPGDTVKMPAYIENEGKINQIWKDIFIFDNAYIDNFIKTESVSQCVVKLLVSEGSFFIGQYSTSSQMHINIIEKIFALSIFVITVIMILFCLYKRRC